MKENELNNAAAMGEVAGEVVGERGEGCAGRKVGRVCARGAREGDVVGARVEKGGECGAERWICGRRREEVGHG